MGNSPNMAKALEIKSRDSILLSKLFQLNLDLFIQTSSFPHANKD